MRKQNIQWSELAKSEKRLEILQRFKMTFAAINNHVRDGPLYNRVKINVALFCVMLESLWSAELPTLE